MKRALLLCLSFIVYSPSFAQPNLVPNYSFENKIQCVTGGDEFTGYVANWTGQQGGGLSWMTAQCNSSGYASVPLNYFGYQNARTGNSYAELLTFLSGFSNRRDYIQDSLTATLVANKKYCVTFYVSLADTSQWACSDIGAYLSDSLIYYDANGGVKSYLTPQIANDPINNPLTSKTAWTRVTGSFIASGGEQYIIIGNFKDDAHSTLDSVGSAAPASMGPDRSGGNYYLDDVFVHEIYYAHAGKDTNICNTTQALIGADTVVPGISYYWSPTTGLSNPNLPQTYAAPASTTTYTLTLVNDSLKGCGCPDSISTSTVTVEVCSDIFVPTAFSPNGDGQNDELLVKGSNIATFYMAIYDRWGNKVFESENIEKGWNGTYKNQPENAGTYIYHLNGTYADGTSFEKKGNVTLVR